MVTRRELLRRSATGALIGTGLLAGGSRASSGGYWFGDGVNLQPAYYCGGEQDVGWSLLSDHAGIRTVRIELEPPSWGQAHSGVTLDDYKRLIDDATARGLNVVATCHHYPYNGSGDSGHLEDAAWWWASPPANKAYSGAVYDYLSQDASFTMNLMNEWGDHHENDPDGSMTAATFASAYNDAISIVRDNTSYTGDIIVDIPGYGQEYQVAADAAPDIEDSGVVFSGHVYPSAWNAKEGRHVNTSDLEYLDANSAGYDCILGEFGANKSGGADWSALVDAANDLGWPVLAWAWNGDGEADPMNMVDPFWGDACSPADGFSTTAYFQTVASKLGATETRYLNAEYADLDGTVTATSRTGYWGDGYVTGFDNSGDAVTMRFDSAHQGERTVKIRYASEYDDKRCALLVNGTVVDEPMLRQTESFVETTAGTYWFNSGENTITIRSNWGYYDIDAVVVLDGERQPLAEYADQDGVVRQDGVLSAVDDWRAGRIGTGRLLDVVGAWRSGEPVG